RGLAVMLTAHQRIIRAALPYLRKSKSPRIVNIASTEALGATALHSPYSAAKAGVAGLTRSLAVELGRDGITVNCICPGPILTGMTARYRQLHPHFFGEVSGVDLRKPLTPQEAADIEAGMDKYAVLLFRNQDITDEQQLAFALNFGEREKARGGTITKKEDYRLTS